MGRNVKEKYDIDLGDEFFEITRTTKTLKALRESIREADHEDLYIWQDMADLILEHEVVMLNAVLADLSRRFTGLKYKPIEVEELGGSYTVQHVRERNREDAAEAIESTISG